MINELEILKSVNEENRITQRELAKRTGLSLGSVNVLLKRLIYKGLIKIEHINSKTIKYIITPKGLMEKARLTYQYIVNSYNYISGIEQKVEQIIRNKNITTKVILYGIKDELYDIITAKLKSLNEVYDFVERNSSLNYYVNGDYIIITWHPEDIEDGLNNGLFSVNVLK
ncbi:winged helix-turn-helix transcriptional regulator [Thermoclostridium stercorarium]|uniref:winged helix-turn-helix transcriptional regulator n=1 Tax=Thermoclostridium stercorarium TaxID=1510 RepID=UPI002248BABA|nr:winged helix-turn-helix transcriptional regulator [Thermoclostridium stercorarium]UZQ85761.1 winged helix-turn-helix transcriptional regulator [Thermoclostridium stercorarium]